VNPYERLDDAILEAIKQNAKILHSSSVLRIARGMLRETDRVAGPLRA
jgi:hypothetical protein